MALATIKEEVHKLVEEYFEYGNYRLKVNLEPNYIVHIEIEYDIGITSIELNYGDEKE